MQSCLRSYLLCCSYFRCLSTASLSASSFQGGLKTSAVQLAVLNKISEDLDFLSAQRTPRDRRRRGLHKHSLLHQMAPTPSDPIDLTLALERKARLHTLPSLLHTRHRLSTAQAKERQSEMDATRAASEVLESMQGNTGTRCCSTPWSLLTAPVALSTHIVAVANCPSLMSLSVTLCFSVTPCISHLL